MLTCGVCHVSRNIPISVCLKAFVFFLIMQKQKKHAPYVPFKSLVTNTSFLLDQAVNFFYFCCKFEHFNMGCLWGFDALLVPASRDRFWHLCLASFFSFAERKHRRKVETTTELKSNMVKENGESHAATAERKRSGMPHCSFYTFFNLEKSLEIFGHFIFDVLIADSIFCLFL